ncbi:hypothetical protein WJX72_012402 [[Myrmecia] bisecta]|uniref:Uncharacterized protein n=1 Tax=[Myrmecia] bisecta TaxID=41462 RepID=A0AAW1PI79_9CHLO
MRGSCEALRQPTSLFGLPTYGRAGRRSKGATRYDSQATHVRLATRRFLEAGAICILTGGEASTARGASQGLPEVTNVIAIHPASAHAIHSQC